VAKRPRPEPKAEPMKHLWVDIGIRVKVPLTTPTEEHQATSSQVLTMATLAVQKALTEYQKTHAKGSVEFDIT